ncbi:MAG TPA: tRNA (adenosine(37)-N6)-threonylcarbamoyltransferase complex dimerization subunit type 1 TsaB [Gemmatimonadaceae bacterium]
MMRRNILVIETSTESGSIAMLRDGGLVAELAFVSRDRASGARTEALAPAVARCLADSGVAAADLSAVICGAGPGGFTSLRSAAALAKGLCSALHIPLYGVSSLELLAWSASVRDGVYVAALPAGRNEWFFADVRCEAGRAVVVGDAGLIGDDDLRDRASRSGARLIGPGLEHDAFPNAASVVSRLEQIEAHGAVDLDSWEPAYGRLAEAQVKWEATHGRSLAI